MKKLFRSRKKTIGGVCAGIASHFNMDPVIVKLVFILGTLFTVFPFVITYVIMWVAVPIEEV
jgi:phage shock protein C